MNNKDRFFPQYRKLVNEKAYYKIIDARNFEEIQLIGSTKKMFKISATKYPEILKIDDMINLTVEYYLQSSEKEWNELIFLIRS
jgi:hypothetical protein